MFEASGAEAAPCRLQHACCEAFSRAVHAAFMLLAQSLFARPGANQLVLRKRKGFIKVALRSGASLVPVYVFGAPCILLAARANLWP